MSEMCCAEERPLQRRCKEDEGYKRKTPEEERAPKKRRCLEEAADAENTALVEEII